MPDAEAHAAVVISYMFGNRAQAVMAGIAAAKLDPELARRQFNLVVKHDDVARIQLVEICRFRNRPSRLVHERARQQQQCTLSRDVAFDGDSLKASPPRGNVEAARN